MKLTNIEKETIVNFNEEEDTAEIYTHNQKLQNRLRAYVKNHPKLSTAKGITFIVPKSLLTITVRAPISQSLAEQRRKQCEIMNEHRKVTHAKENFADGIATE